MPVESRRLQRERRTIQMMIEMYCRGNHVPAEGLCVDCQGMLAYAMQRIERCPFKADKPTCAKCTVHCYQPKMRARVREIMRYSGPRMLAHYPLLAIAHLFDQLTHPPKQIKNIR